MIVKAAITGIITVAAAIIGYYLSPSYREKQAQKERDKIAAEVAHGDEEAVNARLSKFRVVWPWLLVGLLVAAGCAVTKTVYVKENDRSSALKPGQVYTNTSETVEWVVPRTIMTKMVIKSEGL